MMTKTLRNCGHLKWPNAFLSSTNIGRKVKAFQKLGNKLLNKGQCDEAIKYYERALGCFRYLEVVEPPESESEEEDDKIGKTENTENLSEKELKELKEMRESAKQWRKEQREFKKQYRSLMTVYTDDNVKYRDIDHFTVR